MNMLSAKMKARSASAAYGSVRAEGLKPSIKTQKKVDQYIKGKITKKDLRKNVVKEIRAKHSR